MHWASQYIGLPYHPQGAGPNAFHCWSFVRHVQKQRFDRDLPEVPNPEKILGVAKAFRDHSERERWQGVEKPEEGDCVLLCQSRHPVHVGIWLEADRGGVLHCEESKGVVFQDRALLRLSGWQVEGFYKFVGDQK
jgi:cell wall-associated NlpC family hydrolase